MEIIGVMQARRTDGLALRHDYLIKPTTGSSAQSRTPVGSHDCTHVRILADGMITPGTGCPIWINAAFRGTPHGAQR
jgi:hypothetical protein